MAPATKRKQNPREMRSPGIDVKAAVAIATKYFRENFLQAAKSNTMLEEIEEDRDDWIITLGYDRPYPDRALTVFSNGSARAYKRFTISKKTGRVVSAKIYSVT